MYGSFCLLQAVSRVASSPTRESGERAHVSPSSPDRWKPAGNVARRRPEAVTNACVSSTFCAHLIRHCLIYGGPCLNHGGGGRRDCLWRMKCSIYPEEALSATVSAVEDVCGLTVSRSEPSRCLHNLHISGNTGAWLALQRHPSLALVCWGIDGEGNGTCRDLTPAQQPYHAPRQRQQKQWAIVAANDVRCISKLFGRDGREQTFSKAGGTWAYHGSTSVVARGRYSQTQRWGGIRVRKSGAGWAEAR